MSDQFLEQLINIKFCVKSSQEMDHSTLIWSWKQITKFAMETANNPTTQESLCVENTNEDNPHHFPQYQG